MSDFFEKETNENNDKNVSDVEICELKTTDIDDGVFNSEQKVEVESIDNNSEVSSIENIDNSTQIDKAKAENSQDCSQVRLIRTDFGLITEEQYYQIIAERNKQKQADLQYAKQKSAKLPLVFSLIGMLLSIFGGGGSPFSIVGIIISSIKLRSNKSQSLKWGLALGICGLIMNIAMFFILSIFMVKAGITTTPPIQPNMY